MARTCFFITVKASIKGIPYPYPYTFHLKKKDNLNEALKELCKETNRSLKDLPPIIKIKTHTKKNGLITIYG